ncbi:MAG: glycoside hydrolase family 16 protein [Cytophagales bacterium]|nr:glycoside hydrolase family 16 protein [Cytophagales bacterium]
MNRSAYPKLIALACLLSLAASCSNQEKQKATTPAQKEASIENPKTSAYDPGAEWQLSWADEFDGTELNEDDWNRQIVEAGHFNEEWQRYTNSTNNAYIDEGVLVIKAIHESGTHGLDQYTSARLNTAGKQSWKYGKIAARMKLPYGQGIWPAFWMLGANINENGGDTPWPQCGEIDIFELYGSKNDAEVEGNLHYANANNKHTMMGAKGFELEEGIFADDFHIFELEWTEEKMVWLVDGHAYHSQSITAPELSEFHEPFFILLNVAVGGTYADYPDVTSTFPQMMYVDWVRVYQ